MCGIVGAIAERNVVPILMEGLRRLEYRGYDSAGIAVLNGTAKRGNASGIGQPRGQPLRADDPMLAAGGIDPVVEVELHPGGSGHDEHGVGQRHPPATVARADGRAVGSVRRAHHSPS
jgi:hypothetical protein